MVRILAKATGSSGMAGGQAIDLDTITNTPSMAKLESMHRMKTGALIAASVQLGIRAAGVRNQGLIDGLTNYAKAIGLTYQITDDVLDDTSDSKTLGKPQGADRKQQKHTYLTVFGETDARQAAVRFHRQAGSFAPRKGFGP